MSEQATEQREVTLFDAKARFYACRVKLDDLEAKVEALAGKQHPGVRDLVAQFAMLRSLSMKAAQTIEKEDPKNDARPLKRKALTMITNFEILIYDFEEILSEAYEELVDFQKE